MEISVLTASGESKGTLKVSDNAFGREFNEPLIHQVITAYLAGGRAGTRAHKNRSDVRGGGRKPWKQKGSGRARVGTIRSPLWRGGGKTFAARTADYTQKINKKMYRGALQSILSELVRQARMVVIDNLSLETPKTKELASKLAQLGVSKALIVTDQLDNNLVLAARNLPHVDVIGVNEIDPVRLVGFDKILISAAAVKQLEERFA